MGLKVNKKIYSRVHDTVFDSMYCRIESVTYQKVTGELRYTLQFYHSREGMENTYPKYLEDFPVPQSAVIPFNTKLVVDNESVSDSHLVTTTSSGDDVYGVDIQLPLFNKAYLTDSVTEMEPVYETREETTTVTYSDYDEEGNLVEETREEKGSVQVQVGEEPVTKTFPKKGIFQTRSIYEVAYELAKENLEKFFGEGTIEDKV